MKLIYEGDMKYLGLVGRYAKDVMPHHTRGLGSKTYEICAYNTACKYKDIVND